MADLTFREQAAIAAMREEMRDSLDDVRGMPDGYHADITREAWLFADAMEAERQKRTAMGEPAKAEAEARRATLEEVSELLWTMRKSKPVATPVRDALSEARDAVMRLIGAPMPPDPCDAELTKLRAVADAAEKFIGLVRIGFDPLKGDARKLLADMEHDLAGWRTKEGGR